MHTRSPSNCHSRTGAALGPAQRRLLSTLACALSEVQCCLVMHRSLVERHPRWRQGGENLSRIRRENGQDEVARDIHRPALAGMRAFVTCNIQLYSRRIFFATRSGRGRAACVHPSASPLIGPRRTIGSGSGLPCSCCMPTSQPCRVKPASRAHVCMLHGVLRALHPGLAWPACSFKQVVPPPGARDDGLGPVTPPPPPLSPPCTHARAPHARPSHRTSHGGRGRCMGPVHRRPLRGRGRPFSVQWHIERRIVPTSVGCSRRVP